MDKSTREQHDQFLQLFMEQKMKQLMILVLVLMAGTLCRAAEAKAAKADFYLSPNGSDAWSGRLSNPNAQGTDGPFATLERARDAVRVLKKQKLKDVVVLSGLF